MNLRYATLFIFAFVCQQSALAHESHSSLTEMEWNPTSERFEVAMRLRIADLEDAISMQLQSRFRLESDSRRDSYLKDYLKKHFAVTFAGHCDCRLYWVGCELELHDVWIYFEAESVANDTHEKTIQAATMVEMNRVKRWQDLFDAGVALPKNNSTPVEVAVSVRNAVLLEVQPEQLNLITLTRGRHTVSATLTHDTQRIAL